MADEKAPARKKGLHGWKAALAVFGCGSLAAFGVFGIVVSLIGALLSTTSSGIGSGDQSGDSSAAGVDQGTTAREEFVEDKFDLCRINLPSISGVSLILDDSVQEPVDTSIDGGPSSDDNLVRSGECGGRLTPAAVTARPWEFDFSYRAIIFSPEDNRDEIAEGEIDQWRDDAEEVILEVEDFGEFDLLDQAYYVYGSSSDCRVEYIAIARKRSALLRFSMCSGDENTVAQFENEVLKFENHLDLALENLIPE